MSHSDNLKMAREIARLAADQGGRTFYVGGFVRDALIQKDNKDVDIEVHGISPQALEEILDSLGQRMTIGENFGIFGLKGYDLDIAMPRKEEARGQGHRDFDIFVDSEENSECAVVGGCAYEDLARRIPEVKIFTLENAIGTFSDIMWVMQQILFMSMDKRLAIFLLDESAKTGKDTVKLTHEQIAKYMGSAREVVSRMLKYFSSEGIVSYSRSEGIRLLDKKRLRELAL